MEFQSTEVGDFIDADRLHLDDVASFWAGAHDATSRIVRKDNILDRDVAELWRVVCAAREGWTEGAAGQWSALGCLLREGDLSVRDAWMLWVAIMDFDHSQALRNRDLMGEITREKFSALPELFMPDEVLGTTLLKAQLAAYYKDWQSFYGETFSADAPLCGLLALLIEPRDAWRLWCAVIPSRERGAILDWIHVDERFERDLEHAVRGERSDISWPPKRDVVYWLSSLRRYPDRDRLLAFMENVEPYMVDSYEHYRCIYQQTCDLERLFFEQYMRRMDVSPELILYDLYANQRLDLLGDDAFMTWFTYQGKSGTKVLETFSRLHSAHMAHVMLSCYDEPVLGKVAQRWLLEEGANAIFAATELLEKGKSKKRDRAVEVLRRYRDLGALDLIATASSTCSDRARARLEREVLEHYSAEQVSVSQQERPPWLLALMEDRRFRRKRLPSLISLEALPPLRIRGSEHVVSDAIQELLVHLLRASTPEDPAPEIALFREWLDAESAAKWAMALCELWLRDKGKGSHKWMLFALTSFGDDTCARWLGKNMKSWKGARAGWGVDTLAFMSRDAAWRELFVFAGISRDSLRKQKSVEHLTALARHHGCPLHVLEDMVQPHCGFDASGKRRFDYGPRQFVMELDETLEPHFWDEQKQVYIKSLPRGAKTDDPRCVELAREAFKQDKELLKRTIKKETQRLEDRMLKRAIWPASQWRAVMLEHPLLLNLAKRLLWFGDVETAEGDRGRAVFRVTQELSLADDRDEPVSLIDEASQQGEVLLLHPVQLDPKARSRWTEILLDYEVIQPFEQLDERTNYLTTLSSDWEDQIPHSWLKKDTEIDFEILLYHAMMFDWRFVRPSSDSRREHNGKMYTRGAMVSLHQAHRLAIVCEFGSEGYADYGSLMTFLGMSFHELVEGQTPVPLEEEDVARWTDSCEQIMRAPRLPLTSIEPGLLNEALSDLRRMMGFEQ